MMLWDGWFTVGGWCGFWYRVQWGDHERLGRYDEFFGLDFGLWRGTFSVPFRRWNFLRCAGDASLEGEGLFVIRIGV